MGPTVSFLVAMPLTVSIFRTMDPLKHSVHLPSCFYTMLKMVWKLDEHYIFKAQYQENVHHVGGLVGTGQHGMIVKT